MTLQKIKYYQLKEPTSSFSVFNSWRYGNTSLTNKLLEASHIEEKNGYFLSDKNQIEKSIQSLQDKITFIKSLDGIKNVKFFPNTKFNRSLFRQMYPDINIRRSNEKAEAIIYDKRIFNVRFQDEVITYCGQTDIYVDYYLSRLLAEPQSCKIKSLNNTTINFSKWKSAGHNNMVRIIKDEHIDHILNAMTNNLPYIDISNVFENAKTEMRNENLDLENLKSIYEQISHKDPNIQRVGADILVSLDTTKYLPIQTFLWGFCNLGRIKSHKIELFVKYMADNGISIYMPKSLSYRANHSFNNYPLVYINDFSDSLCKSAYTESMDYNLLSDFINTVLIKDIKSILTKNCHCIDISDFTIKIKHPKANSSAPTQHVCAAQVEAVADEWIL